MARQPRLLVAGYPHHLIQRGHNRQPIVLDDRDRIAFLEELRHVTTERHVRVHAYVLMDNHVHLLVTPEEADGLSRTMQSLGRRYVGWFNHRHGRTGGLWEGRFRASVVDTDLYFLACQRYIELNPVRAGLVADAADFAWSSARHHLGQRNDPIVSDHPSFWALGNTPFEREAAYRALLQQGPSQSEVEQLTRSTLAGKVLGGPAFVSRLGEQIERSLVARPRGRPRRLPPDGA